MRAFLFNEKGFLTVFFNNMTNNAYDFKRFLIAIENPIKHQSETSSLKEANKKSVHSKLVNKALFFKIAE